MSVTAQALLFIMVCRLFNDKPLSEPWLNQLINNWAFLGINFCATCSKVQKFSYKKMNLNMFLQNCGHFVSASMSQWYVWLVSSPAMIYRWFELDKWHSHTSWQSRTLITWEIIYVTCRACTIGAAKNCRSGLQEEPTWELFQYESICW